MRRLLARREIHRVLVFAVLATAVATGTSAQSLAPAGWDAELTLAGIVDHNPEPGVVEFDLTARLAEVEVAPGSRVQAWTYNGGLPGPLIRARVGDRLIVHFRNELPQATTVHWHGVRVPIEMDGVPDVSQPNVEPGESFTYDFVLRDPGLFWYHPHVMSAAQVGFGLYGPLLVEEPDDGVGVADQLTLVLSDISFDRRGVLEAADSGGPAGMVFGREGAYVLVNGRTRPTLRARAGAPQRWRVVNAAKSRYFFLNLEGQPFTIIGGDGGLQEHPVSDNLVLVSAGERVDLLVSPTGAPGSEIGLTSMLYNRGYGSVEYRNVEQLLTIAFTQEAPLPVQPAPAVRRAIAPVTATGATGVEITITLPPAAPDGTSEFRVNGVPSWKATPYHARLGETQLWTVRNETEWDHPFHLHGFFFMPVDENAAPLRPLAWKDTLNIPMKSTARFLVTFDERPGAWMFHCHILDHADGGFMGMVQVGPVTTTEHPPTHSKKP